MPCITVACSKIASIKKVISSQCFITVYISGASTPIVRIMHKYWYRFMQVILDLDVSFGIGQDHTGHKLNFTPEITFLKLHFFFGFDNMIIYVYFTCIATMRIIWEILLNDSICVMNGQRICDKRRWSEAKVEESYECIMYMPANFFFRESTH